MCFKAAFNLMELKGGVEITTIANIPSRGTGLGSTSTLTEIQSPLNKAAG
jgi:D-glycero-alpha-D-manno-heptose-7-phosphate kinase